MLGTRTGTLVSGTPVVTGLPRTDDLFVGENVYGAGIPVCTTVLSIDSGTQVTLSENATQDGAVPLEFTPASPDLYLERCTTLRDIHDIVWERGEAVQVILRDEQDVSRGRYNSINKRDKQSVLNVKAYPVEFSPSQKQLEKAGLREQCNVSIYLASKDLLDQGVSFEDIEFSGKSTVLLRGTTYEVRDKGMASQVADAFGYITLGLFRR